MNRSLFNELFRLRNEMNEAFGNHCVSHYNKYSYPYTNIYSSEENYKIVMLLPGVEPEKVNISYQKGSITISGEKPIDVLDKKDYIRKERVYGTFSRTYTVSNSIDPNTINAEYKEGILTITMNKAEEAKPKKININ